LKIAGKFKLLSEYKYKDSKGTIWIVPEGVIVDGASVPTPLWSIIGSPWSGKYRNASVIHDYFFDTKKLHIPAHHEHPFRTNVNTDSGST
jgi:hypothetical protein